MNLSPHRRIWLAATVLLIPGWASASHAEEEPKPPVSARALAETPFQLVLPRAHLAGDWFGVRTWLEDHGVNPTLTFVTDALGNPSGGVQHGFTAANNLGVDLLFDLHKLVGIDGGWFEVSFSERFGSSLSKDDIGNVFTVQQVFGGETYRIVDVAYRQRLFGDRVEFRVGRIAAGDDFLVSPYDYVFVQNGFDGNPVGVFFNARWGGLVKVKPTERTYLMGGVYNGDPTIRDNSHHGGDWSLNGPLFAIGEVGYRVDGLPGNPGLLGNYKAGFWYDHSQYTDFNTLARGQSPGISRGNWGVYGLFDQVLVRFGEPGSSRGFGVTGSLLVSPDQSVSRMPFFATAGLLARGLFPSRATDVAGFGVVYGRFSNDLQDSQRRAQQSDPTVGVQQHEVALELTYRLRFFGDALSVQPDLQYVIRPGGTGQIGDAFVCGLQGAINF